MRKTENPFRIFFDRAYDYFTQSFVRVVFFFALVGVLIFAIILRFWMTWFTSFSILLCAAIASFATFVDSIQQKRLFMDQLRGLESDYVNRVFEKEGEEGLATMKGAFSMVEIQYMKKKKREHNYTIAVKLFFVIIFVVLLIDLF